MRVDAGSLTTLGSLEAADPELAGTSRLSWASTSSFQASARVLDTAALSKWQDWLVAATIALTLAASLLAAVLFDLVPPLRLIGHDGAMPRTPATNASTIQNAGAAQVTLRAADQRHRNVAVAVALGTICAWALKRRSKDTLTPCA
jgi:hypothetical protein